MASPSAHRSTIGKVILAVGILALVMPASPPEPGSLGQGKEIKNEEKTLIKECWSWPKGMSPPYRGCKPWWRVMPKG